MKYSIEILVGTLTILVENSLWFSSVPSGKGWDAHQIGHNSFLPNPFEFIIHLII
jgi:hypothetical protein